MIWCYFESCVAIGAWQASVVHNGLLGCKLLRDLFGNRFVRFYASIKRHEYNTFLSMVSAWEREHLLLNV